MTRGPLHRATAWRAVARCFLTSMVMLGRREIHWPREHVGRLIRFADGTAARVVGRHRHRWGWCLVLLVALAAGAVVRLRRR